MAEEEDVDLSEWDDVIEAEPEKEVFDSKGSEEEKKEGESDDENWEDAIAIEILENYGSDLMKELESFRKDGILCDAVIAVDDRELPVHKNVISAISPFFKNIFSKISDPNDNKITLRNLSGNTMDDILHFSYTGEVCIHDGNVRQLLAASNFLQLKGLKEMATSYLEKKLSPASSVDILLLADKHKCSTLLELSEKLITDNFVLVSKTQGFKKLTFEMLHQFVQSEHIRVSKEEEVYEAVISWVKSDYRDKREEKLNQLADLLREIRFPLMSPSYITEISMDSLILDLTECYEIVTEGLAYHNPNNTQKSSYDRKLTKPRKFMGVVWSIISVGGWQEGQPTKNVLAFVESNQNWFPLTPLPTARYSHSVVACDGFVYVLGGRDNNTKLLSSVVRFDPAVSKWLTVKPLPYQAASLGVCVFEGQIFVVGGLSLNGSVDSVLRYSSRYNVWQRVGNMNYPRGAAAVVADDKFMYAMGGMRKTGLGVNAKWEYLDSMEIYKRDTNSWTTGTKMVSKRAHGAAVYMNEKIYVTGGQSSLLGVTKGMEMYNTSTKEWTSVPYVGVPRTMGGIAVCESKFYVIGGASKEGDSVNTVETYDTTNNRLSKIVPLPSAVSSLQCCALQLKLAVMQGISPSN